MGRTSSISSTFTVIFCSSTFSALREPPLMLKFRSPKRVLAVVKGRVSDPAIRVLRRGVWISEGKASPARVKIISRRYKHSAIEIVLREGKNREIRRILAKIEHPVISLKRIKIGPLKMHYSLRVGKYRVLSKEEVESLYALAVSC